MCDHLIDHMGDSSEAVIEHFYQALAARDRERLGTLLSADIKIVYHGQSGRLPWAGQYSGADGFDKFLTRIKTHVDIVEVKKLDTIAAHAKVVVQCSGVWRMRATGKLVTGGMVNIFTLRNGVICQYEIYADTGAFADAMAAPPVN